MTSLRHYAIAFRHHFIPDYPKPDNFVHWTQTSTIRENWDDRMALIGRRAGKKQRDMGRHIAQIDTFVPWRLRKIYWLLRQWRRHWWSGFCRGELMRKQRRSWKSLSVQKGDQWSFTSINRSGLLISTDTPPLGWWCHTQNQRVYAAHIEMFCYHEGNLFIEWWWKEVNRSLYFLRPKTDDQVCKSDTAASIASGLP